MKNLLIILIVFASFSLSAQSNKSLVFNQGFGVAYYQSSSISLYDNSSQLYERAASSSFKGKRPFVVRKSGMYKDRVQKVDRVRSDKGTFECHYQMRLKYRGFFAVSNTYIFMNKAKGLSFAPTLADFRLDFGYQFKAFKLSLGHQCLHSIDSKGYNDKGYRIAGGYNRIKLTYNIID